jgi:hypothetical protein
MKLAKQIFFAIGAGSFFARPNSPERGNSPRAKQAAGAVAAACFAGAFFLYYWLFGVYERFQNRVDFARRKR